MGLLRQTIAYSQGIMGINISDNTRITAMLKQKAGGFEAAWSSQDLICLVDFTVTFWEAVTAAALPMPATERELLQQFLVGCARDTLSLNRVEELQLWLCSHPQSVLQWCSCPSHPAPGDPACFSHQLWLVKHGKSSPEKCPRCSKVLPLVLPWVCVGSTLVIIW